MELWLEVSTPAGDRHDLSVEIGPSATIGDLETALRRRLGLQGAIRLFVDRLGRTLDDDLVVAATGLRFGDRVHVRTGISGTVWEAPGRVTLTVAGGPGSGMRFELGDGDHAVGRDPACPVHVPDAAMSKRHAAIRVRSDRILVADAGSSNGTFVDGVRVVEPREVLPGQTIECGHTSLSVAIGRIEEHPHPVAGGRVLFHRPSRMVRPAPERVFKLPAPPPRATGRGRHQFERDLSAFFEQVEVVSAEMSSSLAEESASRRAHAPDQAELVRRVVGLAPTLWERRTSYDDFLALRIGTADLPSFARFDVAEGGDERARDRAIEELRRWSTVRSAPVVLDLVSAGAVGVVGEPASVASLARTMLLQTAVLHSPREVVVAIAVGATEAEDWEWAGWLPHVRSDVSPVDAPLLALDDESAASLLDAVRTVVVTRRAESVHRPAQSDAPVPAVVLFVSAHLEALPATLTTILEDGPSVGVHVVRLGGSVDDVWQACGAVVEVRDRPASSTISRRSAPVDLESQQAVADLVPIEVARTIALRLSCLKDVTAGRGRDQIPRKVSLVELLELTELSPSRIRERWSRSSDGLEAPIGMSAHGPFVLDLREHGPHALIAGTTGAGKSELLQSLIASMAASHPPNRVTFLLVDFTGGGAYGDIVSLPHTVGFVTNLDKHLVARVITSLAAELQRREQLLHQHGARDLLELEHRLPAIAPPSLVLVVDEVAKLVAELPELAGDVVEVAQRGRSLGIHLVLATQRPAGTIDEFVRANTNLRIALRMNDAADSIDVIGTNDAALLPRTLPGRAFARTGQTELTELQVASVDGQTVVGTAGSASVMVRNLQDVAQRRRSSRLAGNQGVRTDLRHLVDAISHAAREARIPSQPQPWLPPLPMVVPLWSLDPPGGQDSIAIGVVDLPRQQAQHAWAWNPDDHGVLIVYGASGSGKTTLLRSLAVSAARSAPPDELHIYAFDLATRGLATLRSIPHVGAVITADSAESVRAMIASLEEEAGRRRQLLAAAGTPSFVSYRQRHRRTALPRLLVLVDAAPSDVASGRSDADHPVERLLNIARDGRTLGINVVVTTARPEPMYTGLPSSTVSRVVLRLHSGPNDGDVDASMAMARNGNLPPGRGYVGNAEELQVAIVGADPADDAQLDAVEQAGIELSRLHPDRRAPADPGGIR